MSQVLKDASTYASGSASSSESALMRDDHLEASSDASPKDTKLARRAKRKYVSLDA